MIGENQHRNDMYPNKKDIIRTYEFDLSSYLDTYPTEVPQQFHDGIPIK